MGHAIPDEPPGARGSRAGLVLAWAAAVVVVAAPMSLLLAYPKAGFFEDWYNHLWMVAYHREFFARHLSFPSTYNVDAYIGLSQPIFYGPVLYPILGLLSQPAGANVGVRVACVAAWAMQYALVHRLARAVGATALEAVAAGATACWSVYCLTNLYNRCDLPETLATRLMLCAVAAGGLAVVHPSAPRRRGFAMLGAVCAAVGMGSHPPSAVVGGLLLACLAPAAVRLTPRDSVSVPRAARRRTVVAGLLAVLVATVVAPWAYAVASASGRLGIERRDVTHLAGHLTYDGEYDRPGYRLRPLPLASHSVEYDLTHGLTPHVDMECDVALLAWAVWGVALVASGRRDPAAARRAFPALAVSAGLCAALFALTVSPRLGALVPGRIAGGIQFPARLVSFVNIAATVVVLVSIYIRPRAAAAAFRLRQRRVRGHRASPVRGGAGGQAQTCHGGLVATRRRVDRSKSRPSFEPAVHDVRPARLRRRTPRPGAAGGRRGRFAPRRAPHRHRPALRRSRPGGPRLRAPTWVVPDVFSHPWNRLIVDGEPVPFEQAYNYRARQVVYVQPGRHRFEYRFEPDPAWSVLGAVSWLTLALGAASTVYFFYPRRDAADLQK